MRRALVVVPLLLAGLVAAPTPSGAAPADDVAPRLSGKDLPSVDDLATVYPDLAGGSRDVLRTRTYDVNAARDCIGVRTIGRPRQAVWASYYTASGNDPYFQGGESAAPFVHRFGSRRAAKQVMDRLRGYVRRCEGRHDADGTRGRLDALTPPALGQESLGYQISWRYPNVVTGFSLRRELHVVVRDGRRVVDVFLQAESFRPSLDHGVRVAELTLAAS